jgi:hypothetical protein
MKRNNTFVENTKKLKKSQVVTSAPHLEKDVVPASIQDERFSSHDLKLVTVVLMNMISSLSSEMISSDVWILASYKCKGLCEEMGIPESQSVEIINKVLKAVSERRNRSHAVRSGFMD